MVGPAPEEKEDPGDLWETPGFREKQDQEDFLGFQDFLDQQDQLDLKVIVVWLVSLDPLVWEIWVPRVSVDLMDLQDPQVWESLECRDCEDPQEKPVDEACQEVQAQWVPLATANSVRHLGCKLTRARRKKDARLKEQMINRHYDYKKKHSEKERRGTDRPQPSKLNMISAHGTDQTHVSSTALEVTMKLTLITAAVALIRFVINHSSSFIFIEFVLLRLIQVTSMCK